MDIAAQMVKYIVETEYTDLPPKIVEVTKQHILHTLATVIGGSNAPGCKPVVDLVEEWGGKKESSVLVYGTKVPAVDVALANAVMAHALDYCTNDDRTHYKSCVVVVPVSIAGGKACC